jgi:hypothetical protein
MKIQLTKRTECKRLTLQGWLFLLVSVMIIGLVFFKSIHSFLAVSKPVRADILVVDGLLTGYAYDTIVKFIERDKYRYVIATGVDMNYVYTQEDGYNNAELSYKILLTKKIENCRIEKAPAYKVIKDRTFTSAITLRKWLLDNDLKDQSINLVTLGCHARRSLVLYRKVFKGERKVGVISIEDLSYDSDKWYKYSQGVRTVLSEVIGYTYNILFFHPKVSAAAGR